ncbi:MAG TPA: hypothetical protein PKN48_00275 [Bacteroidales bacterium]|nr:hypothetical protein [Bacteroidales bacterium]
MSVHNLPVNDIRMGYYSAAYFWKEKRILELAKNEIVVTMQVFNKVPGALVCGVGEVLNLFKYCTGHWSNHGRALKTYVRLQDRKKQLDIFKIQKNFKDYKYLLGVISDEEELLEDLWVDTHKDLEISTLFDGDTSLSQIGMMEIKGVASSFAHLESIYLGILARSTKIATNVQKVKRAANGKPILFFADRFDRFENQEADGYAASIGGASLVATDAMGARTRSLGEGTMPHALIAIHNGDLIKVADAYAEYTKTPMIALVDFNNDCVADSLEIAAYCKKQSICLKAVRLDTSEKLIDRSVSTESGDNINGVCPQLVINVRDALDAKGFTDVGIVVSGGFTEDKIKLFETNEKVSRAVTSYGVGSSLLRGNYDYTADIVYPTVKYGRMYNPDPKLKKVNWDEI